jgi:hypothetical protein
MSDEPTAPAPTEGSATEAPSFRAPQSQEEFDRMIGPRLERERAKFAGYDDLKLKAEQFEELQRQNETETERLRREATEAQQRAEALSWTLAETAIRSAVVAEASKAGAVDADAVLALLPRDAVTIDDAGRVTGADAAVQALLDAKPFLKAQAAAPPPSFDGGARSNGTGGNPGSVWQVKSRDELRAKTPEQIEALRTGGHLDELLGITTH